MSFFEPPPPPPDRPPPRRRPPWLGPPENELGVAVPARLVLAKTDELAIGVVDVVAYSTGFAVQVALRLKPGGHGFDSRMLMMQMGRGAGPQSGDGDALPDDLMRFGVEFADGRRATSLGPRPRPDGDPPEIGLTGGARGGGGNGFSFNYWIYPLPPQGTLTFALEWPARGIETTRIEIDAAPVIEAGSQSEELWEDDRPIGGEPAATPGSSGYA